ncbi:Homoserine dehydrogenase [[Candida] zeylanoides]
MPSINVAIIGSGVVGSAFIAQLKNLQHPIAFNVVYLARSSKEALFSRDYAPVALDGYQSAPAQGVLALDALRDYLVAAQRPTILVDNTSSEAVAAAYPQFVRAGISIATPNKKAFSSSLSAWREIFDAAASGGLVYHEATVGAGLPIIGPLRDLVATGDTVGKIEGILSGTLSYIFNEFSTADATAVAFSDVVKVAKELGYTEPDPRDDLNGLDVARKVTILARIAGLAVESPTSFAVESLIPRELEGVASADEFLARLPQFDAQMQQLKDAARAEGKVLRFVGSVDVARNEVAVKIGKYAYDHPFAALKGSDNVVAITTARYQNPLIVQGAGAGAAVTAHGVLADVLKVGERRAT